MQEIKSGQIRWSQNGRIVVYTITDDVSLETYHNLNNFTDESNFKNLKDLWLCVVINEQYDLSLNTIRCICVGDLCDLYD